MMKKSPTWHLVGNTMPGRAQTIAFMANVKMADAVDNFTINVVTTENTINIAYRRY